MAASIPALPLTGIISRPAGQREPLTVRLRSLVRGYPKGLGIIKEFLQNADDARASYLHVVMDRRTHAAHDLPNERYAALCGPAHLFANDATFSDQDFSGIQEIGQSVKQNAPGKIGKFGLGFNAAYNVTDFPTFLSRERLFVFDPHFSIVDNTTGVPGIEYMLTPELWAKHFDLLNPFVAGGLECRTTEHPATIFRLPIRSSARASVSEISDEPFTGEDFDDILRHLRDSASDLLLFLQNVHSLRVTVIDEHGDAQTVLRVDTTNSDEVRTGRDAVRQWLVGAEDVASILKALQTPGSRPLSATFRHQVSVQDGSHRYEATWLVTNGLHRGPGDTLLKLAEEISSERERAIPVAGAAARLSVGPDGTIKAGPVEGRAYCGLPLPRSTALNLHVNGYFELSDTRDWLRLNQEGVGRHEQQRLKWNCELLAHGVAAAVAMLIDELADHAADATPSELYALWPDISKTGDAVLPGLTKAVYDRLWNDAKSVIAVDSETCAWEPPNSVTVVPTAWWPRLRAPLAAAKWKLANPEPPKHVIEGFAAAGHPLQALTPAQLRHKWRRKVDVNCALDAAPDPAWRQRQWVTDLLSFCLSDGSNDLAGLPLALHADRRLHTFGFAGGIVFLASEEQRAVFSPFPVWFIDPTLAQECHLTDVPAAKLRTMTPGDLLRHVERILQSAGVTRGWEPNGELPPNAEWLTRVFKYLADAKALAIVENVGYFRQLAIIPDQFGRLYAPGTVATPLWPPAKEDGAAIEAFMIAFRVPLVSGPNALTRALERALDVCDAELVWDVTAPDLIDVLYSTRDDWSEETATYSAEVHDRLIDFLAAHDLDELGDEHVERLTELRIFPTRDRELVTAVEENVFLAEDAKLPAPPGDRRLFMARPAPWRRLLKKAGAKLLDSATVIEAILDNGITELGRKRQHELLTWLRENLDRVLTPLGDEEGKQLLRRIGDAPLFPGDDGRLHGAATLYDPAVTVAREILGPSAVYLALDGQLADHASLWTGFCQRLGMATTLRPADLVAYVDRLIDRAEEGVDAVADELIAVFEHVQDHWATLGSAHLEDDAHGTLAEALGARAWLPSQRRTEKLQGFAAAVIPEDRLYRPSELFPPSLGHLVASQAAIAPFSKTPTKEVLSALGFPTVAPISTVIAHLGNVLNVWQSEGSGELPLETLRKTLAAIYRDLGNRLGRVPAGGDADEDAADNGSGVDTTLEEVRARFAGVPCLWDDRAHRFWAPEKAFRSSEWLGHRRARLIFDNPQQDRGYSVLGRRDAPDANSLLDLLEEIDREHAGVLLDAQDVSVVVTVLRYLSDQTEWISDRESPLPLLTRDDSLAQHAQVYDDDAGSQMDGIRPGAVHIVHPDVPKRLRRALGMPSLADALHRELAAPTRPAADARAQRICEELQGTMRSPEFAAGLRRFIMDRAPEASRPDLGWLRGVEVRVVEPFETILWLTEDGERREVGRGRSQFHFDVERLLVYVSVDAYDAAAPLVARGIQQQLGLGPLGDLSPLSEILRCDPHRIEALLTTLSIRAAREDADLFRDAPGEAGDAPMSFADVEEEWNDSPNEQLEIYSEKHFEAREEPRRAASAELDAAADEAADDLRSVEQTENVNLGLEPPLETLTAGGPSSGRVSEGAPRSDYSATEHSSAAIDERGLSGSVRPNSEGSWRTDRSTSHGTAEGGIPDGAGVPDPEARRSAPFYEASTDEAYTSRGAGEPRQSTRTHESGASRRVVTYVVSVRDGGTKDLDADDDEAPANLAIGRAAEDHVETEETCAGRLVERMPHNNPGFDVLSVGADPQDIRFIEVKGVSGEWGAAGVPLSAQQFALAWRERERYWLYVVEFAQDPGRRRVTRLQDPVGKITQFRIDSGWRALGAGSDLEHSPTNTELPQPAGGDQVTLPDGRSGTIIEVRGMGVLVRLSVQFRDGDVESLLYKPDQMIVSRSQEG
jgi:sacsin